VGFPPGGGTDAVARILAEGLSQTLGRAVVVENRAGAGGQLAAQALKASAADGGTLFLSHDHTISILPMLSKEPGFDPSKDFVPVAGIASFVNAFAIASSIPPASFQEYLDWIRQAGPGQSSVGVPAPASTPEFLVRVLARRFKGDMQPAAYRGSAPMMDDILAGKLSASLASVPDLIEFHKAGAVRILGVLGRHRQSALPNVPSFAELGLDGFEDMPYYGLFAPAGTPEPEIQTWGRAVRDALADPRLAMRLAALGLNIGFMSPDQFKLRVQTYTQAWAQIIQRGD
jgi:tripartite-type tricarboxylate transporter receptor subunit TctC